MNRPCRWLTIFLLSFGLISASLPATAGHLVLSVNDGKYPIIDGVYKVADPASPDTLTILDVASFPPRVIGETEDRILMSSRSLPMGKWPWPPMSVAHPGMPTR